MKAHVVCVLSLQSERILTTLLINKEQTSADLTF